MKKVVVYLFCITAMSYVSCKKEMSGVMPYKDDAQVSFQLGDEKIEITYPLDKPNQYEPYSFGGFSGQYFGIRSIFELNRNVNLQITLGTLLSKNTTLSKEEFEQLIAPGERVYGSLGSYTSFPEIKNGKVEIAFTDSELGRWCSTQITERQTDDGVRIIVKVEQEESSFIITDVEQTYIGDDKKIYYRIKGSFDCMVHKVNAKAKKRMKGDFIGLLPW